MKYEVYSDAASGLHFAVVCDDGSCKYYFSDKNKEEIPQLVEAAKAGEDLSRWNGNDADPQSKYEALLADVEEKKVQDVTDEYLKESN
ncbi:hypothetical protein ACS3UN_01015 [Oscillospiraceae bacterium LTW-04]|nr:hypothetical protein RBH76_09430 [Oscillospiraceae bacterium MB24-C1]